MLDMCCRRGWVEIVQLMSNEKMFANLSTGECSWDLPPGAILLVTLDMYQSISWSVFYVLFSLYDLILFLALWSFCMYEISTE